MMKVIKKAGKRVNAWQLGTGSEMEQRLIEEGKIVLREDGKYELFSQEAVNGRGELALTGDYFKVDDSSCPYPNKKEYFEEQHRLIEGDTYEQIPQVMEAWCVTEEECPEIEFLKNEKGLVISEDSPEKYFNAPLWGSMLSAGKDAVIMFYEIIKDAENNILDVEFNFVAREQFEQSYDVLEQVKI